MSRRTEEETGRAAPADAAAAEEEEGFLARWLRRKREVGQGDVPEEPLPAQAAPVASEPDADGEAEASPRVLTDADMPPIESLTEDSDYSVFLSPGVSEELRRAALRKLFRLPMFNVCGELDGEYYDCRGYLPLGDTITHEMRAEIERQAAKLKDSMVNEVLGDAADARDARGATVHTPAATPGVTPAAQPPRDAAATPRQGPRREQKEGG